eukprot:6331497-Amphidinium_carterae.1
MPSPAANITFRQELTKDRNHFVANVYGSSELECILPHAPARGPKECPCAKTLRMAKDCNKTWHCSAMAKLRFGVFVQLSSAES